MPNPTPHFRFTRNEPTIWISRVVLCESTSPLKIIRDISLGPGLNIVWGVDTDNGDRQDSIVAGHGVGKTCFCRLLRYCLGESTFGTRRSSAEIGRAFSEGYVAAEIHVSGETWAVARPLRTAARSYADQGLDLETMLVTLETCGSYNEFLDVLESHCAEGLPAGVNSGTGWRMDWLHFLAWCSRDQETRFQHVWSWRSSRSDSGTPNVSKAESIQFIRSALGLLTGEEVGLQNRLDEMKKEFKKLKEEQTECLREPQYWINRLEHQLAGLLGLTAEEYRAGPEDGLFDVRYQASSRKQQLETQLVAIDDKIVVLETKNLDLSAELHQYRQDLRHYESRLGIILSSAEELKADIAERKEEGVPWTEQVGMCRLARIWLKECIHLQRRQSAPSLSEAADDKVDAKNLEERNQEAEQARQIVARLKEIVAELNQEQKELNQEKRGLENQRNAIQRNIDRLSQASSDLASWRAIRDGRKTHSRLAEIQAREKFVTDTQAQLKEQLDGLLDGHKESLDKLLQVFDALVKQVLSRSYRGIAVLDKGRLDFQIVHETRIEGEAIDTLVVLLSDVCAMILGASGTGGHPGFVMHDGPREADLSQLIYHRFLRLMAELSMSVEGPKAAPFQYIVTTTTAPPPELQTEEVVRLRLSGSRSDGLLFRKRFGNEDEEPRQTQLWADV